MDMKAFSDENVARCTAPNGFNMTLDSWTLSDWMVATMGELGEAANVLKKLNRVRDGIPGNSETPGMLQGMFADELADTYIYLDLMARAAGQGCPWNMFPPAMILSVSQHMVSAMAMLGAAAMSVMLANMVQRVPTDSPLESPFGSYLRETSTMLQLVAMGANIDFPAAIRSKFDRTSMKIGYVGGVK